MNSSIEFVFKDYLTGIGHLKQQKIVKGSVVNTPGPHVSASSQSKPVIGSQSTNDNIGKEESKSSHEQEEEHKSNW